MRNTHAHSERRVHEGRPALGFTLVEILLVIVIISIIAAVVLVAVNAAGTGGRRQAELATVQGMGLAVSQFEQQFGFPPPLVQDGLQSVAAGAMTVDRVVIDRANNTSSGEPIVIPTAAPQIRLAAVYNPAYPANRRFLEGLPQTGGAPSLAETISRYEVGTAAWREANQRYSKYSLAYYLAGALPSAVDGVDGPGMVRPLADGTFQGVIAGDNPGGALQTEGRSTSRDRFEAFFDADSGSASLVREYFDLDEYRENAGDAELSVADPVMQTDWRHAAIVDGNGKAYRYYRWAPLSDQYGIATTATCQLNIPYVLLDDAALQQLIDGGASSAATIDVTGGNAAVRGASWAIVGAGPDGLFGTEPFEMLRDRLPTPEDGTSESAYRALAKSDNVVEVGR